MVKVGPLGSSVELPVKNVPTELWVVNRRKFRLDKRTAVVSGVSVSLFLCLMFLRFAGSSVVSVSPPQTPQSLPESPPQLQPLEPVVLPPAPPLDVATVNTQLAGVAAAMPIVDRFPEEIRQLVRASFREPVKVEQESLKRASATSIRAAKPLAQQPVITNELIEPNTLFQSPVVSEEELEQQRELLRQSYQQAMAEYAQQMDYQPGPEVQ